LSKLKKYLVLGAAAVVAFLAAILFGREEGKGEGKIDQQTKDDIEKVREAGKQGDAGEKTIDDVWREKP